ncbi:hypothetical protein OUZ56_013205 [Daphnia magna]|uniref:Uncharacterized protein n=1 Tax=Daphnia magna TaxID=35525 RepID=A0ABQ9Z576_9CRUS|nr:hypothetical protein OUZ56_013205 [Daphnia magna]
MASKSAGIEDGKINYEKGEFYTNPPVATCSRKQAVFIIGLILATLLTCSLIIAFVRPSHCGHVEEGLDFHIVVHI